MPFDYLENDVSRAHAESMKPRAREAHVTGLRERAGMLWRLGYSQDDVADRLKQNVAWDFEMWAQRLPDFYAEIDALVADVFRRKPTARAHL